VASFRTYAIAYIRYCLVPRSYLEFCAQRPSAAFFKGSASNPPPYSILISLGEGHQGGYSMYPPRSSQPQFLQSRASLTSLLRNPGFTLNLGRMAPTHGLLSSAELGGFLHCTKLRFARFLMVTLLKGRQQKHKKRGSLLNMVNELVLEIELLKQQNRILQQNLQNAKESLADVQSYVHQQEQSQQDAG
jgi:hypothetical protein